MLLASVVLPCQLFAASEDTQPNANVTNFCPQVPAPEVGAAPQVNSSNAQENVLDGYPSDVDQENGSYLFSRICERNELDNLWEQLKQEKDPQVVVTQQLGMRNLDNISFVELKNYLNQANQHLKAAGLDAMYRWIYSFDRETPLGTSAYIHMVKDVQGDGNCFFYALMHALSLEGNEAYRKNFAEQVPNERVMLEVATLAKKFRNITENKEPAIKLRQTILRTILRKLGHDQSVKTFLAEIQLEKGFHKTANMRSDIIRILNMLVDFPIVLLEQILIEGQNLDEDQYSTEYERGIVKSPVRICGNGMPRLVNVNGKVEGITVGHFRPVIFTHKVALGRGEAHNHSNLARINLTGGKRFRQGVEEVRGPKRYRPDNSVMINHLRHMVIKGSAAAQVQLACWHRDGNLGLESSPARAFDLFLNATRIEQTSDNKCVYKRAMAEAEYNIGNSLLIGFGVKENKPEAVQWLFKAAEKNHTKAQIRLAECFEAGEGVENINLKEAANIYQRAADKGDKEAQFRLGRLFHRGETPEALNLSFYWLYKAATSGYVDAQYYLGKIHYKASRVERNYEQSIYWFSEAGHAHPQAAYYMYISYLKARGVQKNTDYANFWLNEAAALGHSKAGEIIRQQEMLLMSRQVEKVEEIWIDSIEELA